MTLTRWLNEEHEHTEYFDYQHNYPPKVMKELMFIYI